MADQDRIDRLQANQGAVALLARKVAERRSLHEQLRHHQLTLKLAQEAIELIQKLVVPIENEIEDAATVVGQVERGEPPAE